MDVTLGLLALVLVVAVTTSLSRRFGLSAPLVLVVVGVIGSYLPFIPDIALNENLVLIGLLPPLLYAAAIRTSLVEFRSNRRSIGLLSVGFVIFSTIGVGFITHAVFPDIPLAAAFALGAVVAPPDAVAATAIARKVGMPRRIVVILEGESLVNDATALVCLRTAIAATAGSVSLMGVAGDFLLKAGGGVVVGLLVALILGKVRKHIQDITLDTTLSFGAPFAAYLGAEELHSSGVLAVVVCGLFLGHNSSLLQSAGSRISERNNWSTVQFLLENSVFLLIGLQVRSIVNAALTDSLGASKIWWGCAIILAAVLVLRPIWVFPAVYLPRIFSRKIREVDPPPPWQFPTVISWAGMRGVVTLAAVFVIPESVPHREVLVLAALVVVFGTLVLQGLTLPRLVRALGLRGPDAQEDALQHAAVLHDAAEAGLAELQRIKTPDDPPAVLKALKLRTRARTDSAWEQLGRTGEGETPSEKYRRLRLAMLMAERARVLELRDTGKVPDEVLRGVLETLDVEESQLDPLVERDKAVRQEELTAPDELSGACDHLRHASSAVSPTTAGFCHECVREKTEPVHLRMCLTCGNVACCDSSVGKHADRHFRETGHPVMRSVEPGEAWRWCYVDELLG